jgi:dipeptidyl aminopeptidase/acylaminoacyl peptidase
MRHIVRGPVLFLALLLGVISQIGNLTAASPDTGAAQEMRQITIEDMSRFREVGEPRVSPDGAWVAYTVTTQNLAADLMQSDLWMTSWDGTTTLRLTTTDQESEDTPRWSPDGRYLAFLSSRGDDNDANQLWLLPRPGGEAERVTEVSSGVSDYAWSPDGTRMVLAVADSDSVALGDDTRKDRTPPPIVIDRLYFKEDETGYLTHRRFHLFLFDLATRKVEQLTMGDHDDVNPVWSPDGKSIAFLSKRGPDADRTNSWEVYVVEARPGGETRQVTRFEGSVNNPGGEGGENHVAWSPDGSLIAFLQGGPPKLIYYAVDKLAVVPVTGGPVRVLTAGLDRWVSNVAFAPDNKAIYVLLEDDRVQHLVRVPLDGGRPVPVIQGRLVVRTFDVSPTGRIAALVTTTATPPEVFAVDGTELRQLSRQNDNLLAELRLASVEEISFKSRDGTTINGFMVKPPDYRGDTRCPTVLRIHGGPVSQFGCAMDLWYDPCLQVLAARGYVVLAVNPRGSSGRGEAFARAIYADWGNKDAQDVIAAIDYAIARGVADPKRLGVGGWSYGGILTNYVIARDRRFKAATSGAGMSNMLAGYGTDMYLREWEEELGRPWDATAKWLRLSFPYLHSDRIVTPTLFLCGEKDFNVPLLNSEQMYQALRSLGRDTKLVIYPGQYHTFTRPSYLQDRMKRYLDWYDQHLRRDAAATTPSVPAREGPR